MLFLLSPAKKLDETTPSPFKKKITTPFLEEANQLIELLRGYSSEDLQAIMKISPKLANLNLERYHDYETPFTHANAKEAIYLFKGDVYQGLDAYTLNKRASDYLENHLYILSGLYGLLNPFSLIAPYRLEMGTKLPALTPLVGDKTLYSFWGDKLTNFLNQKMAEKERKTLVNLASNEYFKAINQSKINTPIYTPIFKDFSKGSYKVISFYAKKARGLMVRFAAENNITTVEGLKDFNLAGYTFIEETAKNELLFQRKEA